MNPPLRSKGDVAAVREGLADGTIDAIATDHAPHSAVEKEVEFDIAANGIVGLETAFAVALALVREGVLTERRLVEALTSSPARAFGLAGGALAKGAPADIAILDPGLEWRCDPARFRSKGRNSPWKGALLVGRCTHTLVGGRLVHELGKGER
jgi:dihydroorotase